MTLPGSDGAISGSSAGDNAGPTTTSQPPHSDSGQAQTPPAPPISEPGSSPKQDSFPAPVVEQLRRENQQLRANNNEFQQSVLKALGITTDGKPDAETLHKTLAQRDAEVRNLKVGNALADIFSEAGVKPKLTRSVLNGEGLLNDLNPDDKNFSDQLKEIVGKLVADNPELKISQPATPPLGGSGASTHSGNGNAPQQLTEADVKSMSEEEIVEAMDKGLLKNYLGRV